MENSDDELTDRTSIRGELSKMSFEELQKLKEELGSKVYNEAMFGTRREKKTATYKRDNKNRPREMSSKRPVRTEHMMVPTKKQTIRDPRFDSLCGTFDKKAFQQSYSFLGEIRAKEKQELKRELKSETDPGRRETIKYLIQRMQNQDNEQRRHQEKLEKKREEREAHINMLREGKKPTYLKKSEKKVLDLVSQYEELKKRGRIDKHLAKQRKKNLGKDKKKVYSYESGI